MIQLCHITHKAHEHFTALWVLLLTLNKAINHQRPWDTEPLQSRHTGCKAQNCSYSNMIKHLFLWKYLHVSTANMQLVIYFIMTHPKNVYSSMQMRVIMNWTGLTKKMRACLYNKIFFFFQNANCEKIKVCKNKIIFLYYLI